MKTHSISHLFTVLLIISIPVHAQEEWTEWTGDEDGGEEFNNEFHDVDTDNTDSGDISNINSHSD